MHQNAKQNTIWTTRYTSVCVWEEGLCVQQCESLFPVSHFCLTQEGFELQRLEEEEEEGGDCQQKAYSAGFLCLGYLKGNG